MNVFLILPFKSEYEDIYEAVKNATLQNEHTITRAENFADQNDIVELVDEAIKNSDFVIADISAFSETNAVQSEFMKAQKYDKPIVPICIKGKEIPIDLSKYQAIIYDRFRLQETLVKPLLNYLGKSKTLDFLLQKTILTGSKKTIKSIFISYSHVDVCYLERLKVHLKPFEKKGQIDLWEDTKIKAGEKWKDKINSALEKSVVAILLISADFMASDFIVDNELPPLLKAAEEKGKVILPIIVKPCRFTNDENLSKFQAINDPKNPLSKLNENDREEIYVKVADYIDNLVK
jgi:hypothetical protein